VYIAGDISDMAWSSWLWRGGIVALLPITAVVGEFDQLAGVS
jgi:hypothetical protein